MHYKDYITVKPGVMYRIKNRNNAWFVGIKTNMVLGDFMLLHGEGLTLPMWINKNDVTRCQPMPKGYKLVLEQE